MFKLSAARERGMLQGGYPSVAHPFMTTRALAPAQGSAQERFRFGVLVLIDDIVIRLHDHANRIAQHGRREGKVFRLLQTLGRPDGPNEVRVEALPSAHTDEGGQIMVES